MRNLKQIAQAAKNAKYEIAKLGTTQKNEVLYKIAKELVSQSEHIIYENQRDIDLAIKFGTDKGKGFIDRLTLTEDRIKAIALGCEQVAQLADPVGEILWQKIRPNGLKIGLKRVPLGVIGMIYEARPNVTVDAATLCFKAGSSCILRSGKEAFKSSLCFVNIMREVLQSCNINPDIINIVEDTDRQTAIEMMHLNGYIDVLIPRGGASLIQSVVQNATVPYIETGTGNCHVYIDKMANIEMALKILVNAKCQRISVCNCAESLIVHKDIAHEFLPLAQKELKKHNVILHGCEKTQQILKDDIIPATEHDYSTEYLNYELSIKVVENIEQAINHINKYNTGHSECIVTDSYEASQQFLEDVDAAAVYVNASTRFTDGFEFGFGAEIGISTQKLHARGPMGLEALTSQKYVILGNGQVKQ